MRRDPFRSRPPSLQMTRGALVVAVVYLCRASSLPQLPVSVPVLTGVPSTSYMKNTARPFAFFQGKDHSERLGSAIAGTRDSTPRRGGGASEGGGGEQEPIEAELRLPEYEGTFSDYSEIVLQYGYITMFASALPIVTFFAIAEVLVQIRTDRSVHVRR